MIPRRKNVIIVEVVECLEIEPSSKPVEFTRYVRYRNFWGALFLKVVPRRFDLGELCWRRGRLEVGGSELWTLLAVERG